jgi:two-component system, chemotaxis family, protein-glutamate methylesterase/glutaminase
MIRVLALSESLAVRHQIKMLLISKPGFVDFAAAAHLKDLKKLIAQRKPNVILVDLQLTKVNPLELIHKFVQKFPVPVIVIAANNDNGGSLAFQAMDLGAVDAISIKDLDRRRQGAVDNLLEKLMAINEASASKSYTQKMNKARARRPNALLGRNNSIIAIGASTGGTEALYDVLTVLPEVTPGIVIVQHMPAGFTAALAARLNSESTIEIREARDGDELRQGLALIAPGDQHLFIEKHGAVFRARLNSHDRVNRHRPSVDVLFNSVAKVAGEHAIGVLLTGMGADGAAGLLAMKERGAKTIAQDEESSVVYGMPRAAFEMGAAETFLSLKKIPPAMLLASMKMQGRQIVIRRPVSV